MKRILNLLLAAATLLSVAACSSDDNDGGEKIATPQKLYLPRDQYAVDLALGQDVTFEWKNSSTNNVCYQVLFDTETGDFTDPIFVVTSRANGFFPTVDIPSSMLTTAASLAGCLAGESVTLKWTVRTIRGTEEVTGVQEGGARSIVLTRPNTVDPLPVSVEMLGTATENGAAVKLNAALPIGTKVKEPVLNRKTGAMECFTKFTEGEYTIKDDYKRYYQLLEGGAILCTETEECINTAPEEGIYWVYLDFTTMTWSMKKIEEVNLWTHPWFDKEYTAPMTYEGNGVWAIEDYAWHVGTVGGDKDTRYRFNIIYADNSTERLSFFVFDCTEAYHQHPEDHPQFYNLYRFILSGEDWAHTWKTLNDNEGVGMLATFRIYMNNDKAPNYIHERSFK